MKPIEEVYPGEEATCFGVDDYLPMLDSIGDVVVRVDDADWSGDSRVLYRDGDRFGVLTFGWGSCSGCDSLQRCYSYEEVDRLRNGLVADIKWGSREETVAYLASKDWEVEATYRPDKTKEFLEKALQVLKS